MTDYNLKNDDKLKYTTILNYLPEIAFYAICFLIPFMLGHPQLLVGSMVNAALIYAAFETKSKWNLIPLALTPSIAVLTRGLIFGPLTIFLIYMIPFIWISNIFLMAIIRKFQSKMLLSILLGGFFKVIFLASFAYLLFSLGVIPAPVLTAMSIVQIYTLFIGGTLAYLAVLIKRRFA
ncbi:MAG: hypothetical protein ACMXYG_00060 [Candidatus Woesearchaeota archaeon]